MKTIEFIKKVKALGYVVGEYRCNGMLFIKDGQNIATVSTTSTYTVDSRFVGFEILPNKDKQELMQLVWEYASTPIEQRAEEKVYQLRHKWLGRTGGNYLNFVCDEGRIGLTPIAQAEIYKTKATVKQWEEWTGRTWEQLLQEFDEIEVR